MRISVLALPLLFSSIASADTIDDFLKSEMKAQHVPGLALGIVKNGKLVRTSVYGVTDLETPTPITKSIRFEIGSITKQFTAFATMLLVDEGKIKLDDPISAYLPEAVPAWAGIKIRNLLNQNSGLPEYVFLADLGLDKQFDRATFFDRVTKAPLDFQPGATWAYSNTNYALLGFIIAKASGKPYAEFLTERVLKPLGMNETAFSQPYEVMPNRAHGYMWYENQLIRAPYGAGSIDSDGSLMSTVGDMAKWDAALLGRKLLKPESYEAIWAPGKLASGRPRYYGMGWFLATPFDPPYVGHGGNSSGYSAGFARFLEPKLSVIVLGNVYAFSGEDLAKRIAYMVDPSLKEKPPIVANDANAARTAKIKAAFSALAAAKFDDPSLEPELTAPLQSARARQTPGYRAFAKVDAFEFVEVRRQGQDLWAVYRVKVGVNSYSARFLWTPKDTLAQVLLKRIA